jgi:RNA polymerase sigma-70 factor (ECF subfamily)
MTDLEELYRTYKPLLLTVAYRLLGSFAEAEDAVQDVFVAIRGIDMADVRQPQAYLVKMATNRCLNMLKSARRKRELYPGPWLPEPQIEFAPPGSAESSEPSEQLVRRESFGYALLALLQELTPLERAVFVLRDSIGYEYADIAELLGKTEAACRKMYSRAKAKLGPDLQLEERRPEEAEPFVQAFAAALETGQFAPFIRLLTEDAVLLSDGGGKVRAALAPILGRERIGRFFEGVYAKGSLRSAFRPVWMNGQPGLLLEPAGRPPIAICFGSGPGGDAIRTVYIMYNPDKLTRIGK